jgi:hypothetical protein
LKSTTFRRPLFRFKIVFWGEVKELETMTTAKILAIAAILVSLPSLALAQAVVIAPSPYYGGYAQPYYGGYSYARPYYGGYSYAQPYYGGYARPYYGGYSYAQPYSGYAYAPTYYGYAPGYSYGGWQRW